MTLQNYAVYYLSGATEVALTNVQSINISCGVQAQLQQIRASTGTIVIRYPNGYASPITDLVPGTEVLVRNLTTADPYTQLVYRGYISDVSVNYGIPYASSVGPADYLTITLEGEFARLGRMQGLNYPLSGTLQYQMQDLTDWTGVFMQWFGPNDTPAADTNVTGTFADWLAAIGVTYNARLQETANGSNRGVYMVSPFFTDQLSLYFTSPALATVGNQKQIFDQITFDSLADNYYTQVTVDPEDFAAVTATKAGAPEPLRTYQVNTLNASTAQATDYANYLLANFSDPALAISSISATAEAQLVNRLDNAQSFGTTTIPAQLPAYPGCQITVQFRGTDYVCIIEGVTMSATPESARFTYYVSGADLNAYLLLDNATFGRLDFNKLGY
jgi:hypothetical protein